MGKTVLLETRLQTICFTKKRKIKKKMKGEIEINEQWRWSKRKGCKKCMMGFLQKRAPMSAMEPTKITNCLLPVDFKNQQCKTKTKQKSWSSAHQQQGRKWGNILCWELAEIMGSILVILSGLKPEVYRNSQGAGSSKKTFNKEMTSVYFGDQPIAHY